MSRDETPVWIRRRIERRLARGCSDLGPIRIFLKNFRRERASERAEDLPDNVILFPGVITLRMLELATA